MGTNESDRGSKKKSVVVESGRQPLVRAELLKENGVAAHKARIREVSSRYMSTSISTPSQVKRCPSPVSRSNTLPASVGNPKRAVSAERKRPSTPTSPSRISTPVRDIDISLAARKTAFTTQPKTLWPSTMRSLSASFQFDGHPITKTKEKPVTRSFAEGSLRLSSNASHKRPESPSSTEKATPERRRSPLKGKSLLDQTENTMPTDGSQTRLVDQHRWPSRIGGKISSSFLNRSVDLTDKTIRNPSAPSSRTAISSFRRLSDGISKPIQKSSSDVATQISADLKILQRKGPNLHSSTDLSNLLKLPELKKLPPLNLSGRNRISAPVVRSQSLPRTRQPSPIQAASQSKVSSPLHSRPATPTRGVSPSRIRPLSSSSQSSSSSSSVLSFITDFRKPKKNNQLEDAHQLRLLYNRHLQWRFANAQTDIALQNQKYTAETSLKNVWGTNLAMWDTVIKKKIRLRRMKLELKLNFILNEQQRYLDDWESSERDHYLSLTGIVKDLEAATLRLPLTGRASADMESLKVAIGSAMDVMQSMGPSIVTLVSRTEGMNGLVSRLANLAVQERTMLSECETVLALNASMQVEENSLRTHLIQTCESIDRQ